MESRAGRRKRSLAAWMESWELQGQGREKGKHLELLERDKKEGSTWRDREKRELSGKKEEGSTWKEREEGIQSLTLAQPDSQIHLLLIWGTGKDLKLDQGRFSWILEKNHPRKVCQG